MSLGASKAKAKARKKEIAAKKVIMKRILVIGIFVLVLAAVFGVRMYLTAQQKKIETYSAGGQTVQLFNNGKFTAALAHNVRKSGTYTRLDEEGFSTVTFITDGREETGWIVNDSLHIPAEWDDGHGHGSVLPRTNTPTHDGHRH